MVGGKVVCERDIEVCERRCVTKMVKRCVTKLRKMVCDKIVCVEDGGCQSCDGGRRRAEEEAGYRIKNKNPTQRCGENQTNQNRKRCCKTFERLPFNARVPNSRPLQSSQASKSSMAPQSDSLQVLCSNSWCSRAGIPTAA